MSPSRYLPSKDKEFSVGAENVSPLHILLPFQGVMWITGGGAGEQRRLKSPRS
jgi:hypothetical protein